MAKRYKTQDAYFKRAKQENFAARSVYKLQEIEQKWHLLQPGQHLLDLGAAPGSWAQYASQRLGSRGRLLGIDLKPVKQELPNAQFVQADLREAALGSWLAEAGLRDPVDGVLSDMAPSTSGHQRTDHLQSAGLCEMALAVAHQHLRPGGFLIAKMLEGGEAPAFFHQIKAEFGRAKQMRLQSTRKGSKEVFFVGADFRGPAT